LRASAEDCLAGLRALASATFAMCPSIRALAAAHSASSGRTTTGSTIFMIVSRSV
jgi:hypothetical protein